MFHPDDELDRKEYAIASIYKALKDDDVNSGAGYQPLKFFQQPFHLPRNFHDVTQDENQRNDGRKEIGAPVKP